RWSPTGVLSGQNLVGVPFFDAISSGSQEYRGFAADRSAPRDALHLRVRRGGGEPDSCGGGCGRGRSGRRIGWGLALMAQVSTIAPQAPRDARDVGSKGEIVAQSTGCSTRVSILMALRNDPGDQSAWSAFVDRYGPQIHAWCLRRKLQDADARDITQMVMLRLVRNLPNFAYDPSRSFRGWLRTLTAH